MVTVWFESHGTTPDNEARRSSGWGDVDLSELGRRQAAELVERCRDRGLTAIFCSDLQRSVKSAIPLANALRLPIYIDSRLRECDYGDMEGAPSSVVETERPNRISKPFPNGESYKQCLERMESFFDWLRGTFDGQTVLIIGHRATQYGVASFTEGKSLEASIAEVWKWQPGWQYQLQ